MTYETQLMRFYQNGRIAGDNEELQLYVTTKPLFTDKNTANLIHARYTPMGLVTDEKFEVVVSLKEAWQVEGERAHSWCELAEVASAFNVEGDGCFYYCASLSGVIVRPSWADVKFLCHYFGTTLRELYPNKKPAYTPSMTVEERVAMRLMFGD